MNRLLPLYLIILVSLEGKAQTFTGRVTDRSGKPLVSASVVAKGDDGSVVAFARAGQDGYFSLTIPQGKEAKSVEFLMMGFAKVSIPLKDYKNGQTIKMQEQAIALKEVKVTPQRIREQGDTLTYSVESFKMKQDRSIADVIAKMPGLEVLPSGTIRYQGKAINRFYIEGMDLLGGKYAMASENLSADKVKSVQVYENHQPVKALKDIKFSEQAALNLILKDEAKNVWQGVVDVATGYGDEWLRDARWLEMVFGRKKQSISMVKANNTGKDIEHEVTDLTQFDKTAPTEDGILGDISLGAPNLDARRSKFNDTYIAATNWLFKTKQDDDLKLQVTGLYDCSRQQQDRQTVYLDADSAVITEEQTARCTRSAWQAELLYKANRDNHYLSNTLKGYLDFNQSEGLSILNGRPTPQRVEPRKRYIVDNLELINKLKNGQSYSVTSLFSYSYLPGTLLLANDSVQRLTQQMLYWKAYAYYQHSIKQVKVTWQAGFETKIQWLTLGERDRYSEYQPYVEPSVSYREGAWSISLSGRLRWLMRQYQNQHSQHVLAEPRLFIRYSLTSKLDISGSYSYRWTPSDIATITSQPYYTDYISCQQGSGQFENTTGQTANIGLGYRNVMTGLFCSVTSGYSHQRDAVICQSRLVNHVYIRQATDFRQNRETYSLSGSLGKSAFWAKLSMTLNGSCSWTHYDLLINQTLARQHSRNGRASLRFSLKPTRWFSIEEETAYHYSYQSMTNALQSWNHEIRIFLLPGDWQIEWTNELYHSNDMSVSTNCFCDLSISWHTKAFEAGLLCSNLIGSCNYSRHYTTDHTDVVVCNRLRPREFLCKLMFDL